MTLIVMKLDSIGTLYETIRESVNKEILGSIGIFRVMVFQLVPHNHKEVRQETPV